MSKELEGVILIIIGFSGVSFPIIAATLWYNFKELKLKAHAVNALKDSIEIKLDLKDLKGILE